MPVDLLWRTERAIKREGEGTEYVGPSWSWTSVPSTAGLKIYSKRSQSDTAIVDYAAPTIGPDLFGELRPYATYLTLRGRFRQLLQSQPQAIDWPEAREAEDGRTVYPSLQFQSNVYAISQVEAMIFLAKDCREVIIYLDYTQEWDFERLFCLEITHSGFLVLEAASSEGSEYRRVGCTRTNSDRDFFEGSPVSTVKLI